MEITGTSSNTVNHEPASNQINNQSQPAEAEKSQAARETTNAVEVSISRESQELAAANSNSTENLTEVNASEVEESAVPAGHDEAQDPQQEEKEQREERGISASINVFA